MGQVKQDVLDEIIRRIVEDPGSFSERPVL
jgi:hypothetical protein